MSDLDLYRLLAPQFLLGFTFPDEADAILSKLAVSQISSTYDESATIFTGILVFDDAPRELIPGSGVGRFRWEDVEVRFRLLVPRDGAAFIETALQNAGGQLAPLDALLDRFQPVDVTVDNQTTIPTEYPGVRFRLELLLTELQFELSESWKPGKLDGDHRVVRDPTSTDPVRIVLPKVVLAYEQIDDFQSVPEFEIVSWGGGGFDAATSLSAGELVRMDPPIAVHVDGRVGFGLGSVVVDLDPDHTPPEILQFFGTDEAFTGIYVQSARLYFTDEGKSIAFNAGVKDLLISFAGEVSFDASVDLIGPELTLEARFVVVDAGKDVAVAAGQRGADSSGPVTGGRFRASTAATIQVEVVGGVPPVSISVTAGEETEQRYDSDTGAVRIDDLLPGEHTLVLHVQDSAPGDALSYDETVTLTLAAAPGPAPAGAPADRPFQPGAMPAISVSGGTAAAHSITYAGQGQGTLERFRVSGPGTPTVSAGGDPVTVTAGTFQIDVPPGTDGLVISASWLPFTGPQDFTLRFSFGWPAENMPDRVNRYLSDFAGVSGKDGEYLKSHVAGQAERGTAALRAWLGQLAAAEGTLPELAVVATASFERPDQKDYDQALSERRLKIALAAIGTDVASKKATGQTDAAGAHPPRLGDQNDRVAIITAALTRSDAETATLTVSRAVQEPPPAQEIVPQPTPPPRPLPQQAPGVFRRIGIRVKVIRNDLVLVELSGRLDFETDLEGALRNPINQADPDPDGPPNTCLLKLTPQPGAVGEPGPGQDGVVDFRLTFVHDPATHSLTEVLALGAHPDDVNGLLQLENPRDTNCTLFNDLFGAVLIMAPIIGTAIGSFDPASEMSYVALGGAILGPAALGAAGIVQTSKVILYGGELRSRQFIPPEDPLQFADIGLLLDYAVEFGINIPALGIKTGKSLKVRYRALGFNINFAGGGYQPIFDASKGYELDLADPGLFTLPSPIDKVLTIFGARIAAVNPITLELDLGMKIDLGVIKIDRFTVKMPIHRFGPPSILPSSISVNIPAVLIGSGFVKIIEPPAAPADAEKPGFGGIEGGFDVCLVPIGLRVSASFGMRPIPPDSAGRSATAVFLGLIIDLPAPIPLGQSGIGIFGFSGLFAMHYRRLETDPVPGAAVGPAILWLKAAGGEPARLQNNGLDLWGPELDRWSFGIGISLGTVDGGFLTNLRGMFVLELPGPRILIFVKVLVIKPLPALTPATDLTAGMLGVIDLDFARGMITVGIIADMVITEILAITVPVELFANLKDLSDWHLFAGSFSTPASAEVLGVTRGFGYLMIAGKSIDDWPGFGETRNLTGIALAAGIGASVVFGDEPSGLFLTVSVRADIAVSFAPKLFLAGKVTLDGELRLFVVSVGAHGALELEGPDPTHLTGEICGHVDLFFFSVEGCVRVDIGPEPVPPAPPAIVRNVWLQSHAPVITAGQGGDRPIDASLGDTLAGTGGAGPIVPIDAVPVIQFHAPPTVDGHPTTFTEPLVTAPGLHPGGLVSLGGSRRATYELTELRLLGGPIGPGVPKATWRPDAATSAASGHTSIDLALMSNVPMMGARALERSSNLNAVIDGIWGTICDPIAPPAPVLWTFCRQPLGPSGRGWDLTGHAWPDPAGTVRSTPTDTHLRVREPVRTRADQLLDAVLGHTIAGHTDPARVLGPNTKPALIPPPIDPACMRALALPDRVGPSGRGDLTMTQELVDAAGKLEDQRWAELLTGSFERARIYLAVERRLFTIGSVLVEQLDGSGATISSQPLAALSPVTVTPPTGGLPPTWTDPGGPWRAEVEAVTSLLAGPQFAQLLNFLVTVEAEQGARRIRLRVLGDGVPVEHPAVVLAAAEVLTRAEAERSATEEASRSGQVETLTGYLDGTALVPLLAPGTEYTLQVSYLPRTEDTDPDGVVSTTEHPAVTESFRFSTDTEPPDRLDAYVLASNPRHEDQFVFPDDPVVIVFNDLQVVQLYQAYGRTLTAVLRGADGVAIPTHQVTDLSEVPPTFTSPLYDSLDAKVENGELGCLGPYHYEGHASFTLPERLRPSMAYTLDIEAQPVSAPPADRPTVPLFRRQFRTGRFPTLAALVEELQARAVRHVALTGPTGDLPAGEASDLALENALAAAGLPPLGPPSVGTVMVLWRPDADRFVPHALLIDASEPLWRWRDAPVQEAVPDPDPHQPPPDPAFQRIVPGQEPAMVLESTGPVLGFTHSPGGTRTLVLLADEAWPASGGTVTVDAVRPASTLYGSTEQRVRVTGLPLSGHAPWEDEDG